MALPTSAIKPKKKRTAVVLGCDQCRRRKTKCDQARPTCGPCLYAGLMECTFLLGKTPASKRFGYDGDTNTHNCHGRRPNNTPDTIPEGRIAELPTFHSRVPIVNIREVTCIVDRTFIHIYSRSNARGQRRRRRRRSE
ncbi:MAG: hypothetical protein JOS17DRAFT_588877 [Linnemannia elongata]|nr:MAG: hypothetical protein JOS17DRAFT_588877 [Linnemannia elongata]